MNISIDKVKPSKKNYRTTMDKTELAALAASVREKGILQPIIVRPVNNHYEIVAGHRRYAAAMDNGLDRVFKKSQKDSPRAYRKSLMTEVKVGL